MFYCVCSTRWKQYEKHQRTALAHWLFRGKETDFPADTTNLQELFFLWNLNDSTISHVVIYWQHGFWIRWYPPFVIKDGLIAGSTTTTLWHSSLMNPRSGRVANVLSTLIPFIKDSSQDRGLCCDPYLWLYSFLLPMTQISMSIQRMSQLLKCI